MKIIKSVLIDGVLIPSEPIPESAIRVVFDGENYIVYEDGDELPKEPEPELVYAEQL